MWYSVVIGCLVLVGIGLVSSRSPYLAGVLAHIPVKTVLAIWVLYSSGGDVHESFSGMVSGIIATMCLVLFVFAMLRIDGVGIFPAIAGGIAVWTLVVYANSWLG